MSLTLTTLISVTTLLALVSAYPSSTISSGKTLARNVTSSAKTGLAWPNGDADSVSQYYQSDKVSWYYTWSPSPIEDNTLEFVPMLWGNDQADAFASSIQNTISSKNVKAILGMNEPNQDGQSDLSPQDGATLWKSHIQPLKGNGLRLGSPAPTSAPSGKTWLSDFIGACDGCTIDFIACHYYDVNATQFKSYLTDLHNTFQRPIWVTEWACENFNGGNQCSSDDVASFMKETQSFMDETDWVERYAWFGAMENLQGVNPDNALMDKNGKITKLGQQYIGTNSGSANGQPTVSSAVKVTPPLLMAGFVAVALLL